MTVSLKKKGEYSFHYEISSEEDWKALCEVEGLTIVDVYSEWSGPCFAMTAHLKKIKLDINDERLQYAMAKSDDIPQLHMFRGHCTPIWLFMASGDPVAVVHGANAPLLGKKIEEEMEKEHQVLNGKIQRDIIAIEDAVPYYLNGNILMTEDSIEEQSVEVQKDVFPKINLTSGLEDYFLLILYGEKSQDVSILILNFELLMDKRLEIVQSKYLKTLNTEPLYKYIDCEEIKNENSSITILLTLCRLEKKSCTEISNLQFLTPNKQEFLRVKSICSSSEGFLELMTEYFLNKPIYTQSHDLLLCIFNSSMNKEALMLFKKYSFFVLKSINFEMTEESERYFFDSLARVEKEVLINFPTISGRFLSYFLIENTNREIEKLMNELKIKNILVFLGQELTVKSLSYIFTKLDLEIIDDDDDDVINAKEKEKGNAEKQDENEEDENEEDEEVKANFLNDILDL